MVPGLIGLYRNAAVAVPTGLSEFSYATQLLTSPLTHYKVVFCFVFVFFFIFLEDGVGGQTSLK
jgi:heme/copper-type cytochrome/quinol oxidase subunit 1